MKLLKYIIAGAIALSTFSCTEDVFDVSSNSTIPNEEVYKSYDMVEASLLGAYATLSAYSFGGLYDPIISDLMSEDIKLVEGSANYNRFVYTYQMDLLPSYSDVEYPWQVGYATVYGVNNIIVNASKIEDAEERAIDLLVAESKAMRAYCLLQMAHMYCDAYSQDVNGQGLMLPLTPAGLQDGDLSRSTMEETYARIESDLLAAEDSYLVDSIESIDRARLNVRAVQALLARTYLDMERWEEARDYAEKSLEGIELVSTYSKVDEALYGYGFSVMNLETIFGFAYTEETNNIYMTIPSFYYPIYGYSSIRASDAFYAQFEQSDERYNYFVTQDPDEVDDENIIDAENVMIIKFGHNGSVGNAQAIQIRGSEMYLIIAESEAHLGNTDESRIALQKIQANAYNSTNYAKSENSGDDLIDEILLERRKELFGEGFRLSDIKRNQQTVVRDPMDHWAAFTYTPGDENYYKFVLPIPQSEFDSNIEISSLDQNPGYWE